MCDVPHIRLKDNDLVKRLHITDADIVGRQAEDNRAATLAVLLQSKPSKKQRINLIYDRFDEWIKLVRTLHFGDESITSSDCYFLSTTKISLHFRVPYRIVCETLTSSDRKKVFRRRLKKEEFILSSEHMQYLTDHRTLME